MVGNLMSLADMIRDESIYHINTDMMMVLV